MGSSSIRIIGIDPGLRNLGWGIVDCEGTRLSFVACGSVHSNAKLSLADRLRQLHDGLAEIIHAHQPHEAAVEETFVNRDPQSALKLGQARGAAIVAGVNAGLPVFEYSALQVKQAVVGHGKAAKVQVQQMLKVLLNLPEVAQEDASDALAIAVCHAHSRGMNALRRHAG